MAAAKAAADLLGLPLYQHLGGTFRGQEFPVPLGNVIGGGEPTVPGVSIGHNEHGAWGLTVFQTDAEDLYVYETDPDDPDRYRYGDGWERMRVETDTIEVEGRAPVAVELKFTRHGPVTFEDRERNLAFAVRAAIRGKKG